MSSDIYDELDQGEVLELARHIAEQGDEAGFSAGADEEAASAVSSDEETAEMLYAAGMLIDPDLLFFAAALVKSNSTTLATISENAQFAYAQLSEALVVDGPAKDACIQQAMMLLRVEERT